MELEIRQRLVNEVDAAKYLGISVASLRLARYQGHRGNRMELPAPLKLGRAIRYDVQDLEAFVRELKTGAGS